MKKLLMIISASVVLMSFCSFADDNSTTVKNASDMLDKIFGGSSDQIPKWLLDRAEAITIVPNYKNQTGQSVYSIRINNKWSLPVLSNVKTTGTTPSNENQLIIITMPGKGSADLRNGNVVLSGGGLVPGPSGTTSESSFKQATSNISFAYTGKDDKITGADLTEAQIGTDVSAMTNYYGASAILGKVLNNQLPTIPGEAKDFQSKLQKLSSKLNTKAGS